MFFSLNLQSYQYGLYAEKVIGSMDLKKEESLYFYQFVDFVEMINFQNPFLGKTNLWEVF